MVKAIRFLEDSVILGFQITAGIIAALAIILFASIVLLFNRVTSRSGRRNQTVTLPASEAAYQGQGLTSTLA